jgi:hypothetical protein
MIVMGIKPNRPILGKHAAEFIIYPLGQNYRIAGANADYFYMWYGTQGRKNTFQA